MKFIRHVSALSLIIGAIFLLFAFIKLVPTRSIVSPTNQQTSHELQPSITEENQKPEYSLIIPTSYTIDDVQTIQQSLPPLKMILPGWYQIDRQGALQTGNTGTKETLLTYAKVHKIFIIPTISNGGTTNSFQTFLTSKTKQQEAINQLITNATTNNYAGYDVRWEQPQSTADATLLLFIQQLALELAASERILSITVPAPIGKPSDWSDTIGPQWQTLAKTVDSIRIIMDNPSMNRKQPAPLIDPIWYQNVVRFAKQLIPPEKLIIGFPIYGKDWDSQTGKIKEYVQLQKNSLQWIRDEDSGEETATYSANEIIHTVWIEDSVSIKKKEENAQQNHIYQFSIWIPGQ